MKILFNDVIQYADVSKDYEYLKSPSLAEVCVVKSPITINFDKPCPINSIGIGNAKQKELRIELKGTNGTLFNSDDHDFEFSENGLYLIDEITVSQITITAKAGLTHIGRFAAGIAVNIPTTVAKEPAFHSTAKPRTTLSGQVIQGVGGHIYKTVSLDSRYKIDEKAMKEIEDGYFYTSMGYPFFIDLTDEAYKLPFSKLYAIDRNQQQMSFESGVNKFLYSRRFEFEERF